MSPLLFIVGGRNVFCPPPVLFRGRNPYYVVDLLNNDGFSCPLNIMHSKTHLIGLCLAAGLRSDPLGGELAALTRPQLLARENGF